MIKTFKFELILLTVITLVLQIGFFFYSPEYTKISYEGKVYATTGVTHDASDLHKLNEAAHYFGQTMIGWTKFPNFVPRLIEYAELNENTTLNAHIQERQNIIFTVTSSDKITNEDLYKVKDYIQGKLDEYNKINNTRFVLTSLDYSTSTLQNNYNKGALIMLLLSIVLTFGMSFIRREFFKV